ncbi:porin [Azospirillum sp.]|uniref:porin n=1 Tax=Azospirillum sp. TaxID=34012 RepID=UPI0039C892E0
MGSGAANAQAKFEVKVGGDAYFEGGYVDQDLDSGLRSVEFRNRFRLNIVPSAKADNGLEYGGRIRIRAAGNSRNTDADRAYIFVQGSFGQVRMGVSNTFNDETVVSRPIDYLPFGLYDQALNYVGPNGTGGTGGGLAAINRAGGGSIVWPSLAPDVATKIVYFSPRFAGFQFGASYTPNGNSSNTDSDRFERAAIGTGTLTPYFQDELEIGVNYNNTFGGVTVKGSAGYMWGEATESTTSANNFKNLNAWMAGLQVGYAGFAVGGSYTDFGKSGQRQAAGLFNENARVWQLGAQYTTGPIVVGAGWMYGQDQGSATTIGKRKVNVYEIGASYTVAPGLAVQAQYDYVKTDFEGSALDDKANVIVLRTTLAF